MRTIPACLEEKRQELTNKVGRLVQAESFDAVQANQELKEIWPELSPPLMSRPEDAERQRFDALRTYFTAGMDSNRFDEAIKRALTRSKKTACSKSSSISPKKAARSRSWSIPLGPTNG